ncbi:PREDICTED: LEAF RUST 10 DISEASE-RESISTANCE LOCUS RECEPTOR-LIKE PROTEIN KINASE-like 1.2 isoform X3 [Lupinus angustifolius]|uniref:LEAF RUST 10 DISEASE-RESISTANCE LOCUS RECEPTOR-LIKE PROTEIN KINASE-like 1.2 isoform X3 n=1 Tax=Lupinus angustifolius TaxID=3871 RepID=UPI00092FA11E|nr:PREDICTED: LEAF RUST 10 DISEASE-RESISTANCE LOCUS RECEPTOR-LIKE PROTEIN KINASE-like 1.2 isoform X3 [Lupinus angustifolius]
MDIVNQSCPRAKNNISLETFPLVYSPLDLNISFYFNCSSSYTSSVDPISCLKNSERKQSFVYFSENETDDYDWHAYCQEKIVVTVLKNDHEIQSGGLITGFGAAMNNGFVLDWMKAGECAECEGSGGFCGYNQTNKHSMCICKDDSIVVKSCKKENPWNWKRKLAIGVSAAVFGALVVFLAMYLYQRRKKNRYTMSYVSQSFTASDPSLLKDAEKGSQYFGVHVFTYDELEEATNNFDSARELGDGGFGTVYYGQLHDGRRVAVKRLYENNYKRVEQFMNEVEILTRLRHPNLVSLFGCTSRHSRELLLVYEYISNGTVADHLHGRKTKPGALPWHIRMNIAVDTASALKYLHASEIIHRDVKTNNILLDDHFCVKVADFGLSRLFPTHATHISTAPQGTPGYVDPEYHECYQLTSKSDVYSFGVMLIELISSLPAVDITRHRHEINLSNMAINKIQNQALHELVDPALGFESDFKVRKMINAVAELAFRCLQSSKDMRPTMEEVVDTLLDIQSDGKHKKSQPEVLDISADDDVVLLKDDPPPPSPDSNVVSKSTTPNASG